MCHVITHGRSPLTLWFLTLVQLQTLPYRVVLVKLEMFDLSMAPRAMRDEWRCVSTVCGALCVTTSGTARMPRWCAGSWGSLEEVWCAYLCVRASLCMSTLSVHTWSFLPCLGKCGPLCVWSLEEYTQYLDVYVLVYHTISAYHHISISAYQHISISAYQHISISAYQHISISAYQHISISAYQHISISAYQHISI